MNDPNLRFVTVKHYVSGLVVVSLILQIDQYSYQHVKWGGTWQPMPAHHPPTNPGWIGGWCPHRQWCCSLLLPSAGWWLFGRVSLPGTYWGSNDLTLHLSNNQWNYECPHQFQLLGALGLSPCCRASVVQGTKLACTIPEAHWSKNCGDCGMSKFAALRCHRLFSKICDQPQSFSGN